LNTFYAETKKSKFSLSVHTKREGSFSLDCCDKQTNVDVAGKATSVAVCDGFDVGSFV